MSLVYAQNGVLKLQSNLGNWFRATVELSNGIPALAFPVATTDPGTGYRGYALITSNLGNVYKLSVFEAEGTAGYSLDTSVEATDPTYELAGPAGDYPLQIEEFEGSAGYNFGSPVYRVGVYQESSWTVFGNTTPLIEDRWNVAVSVSTNLEDRWNASKVVSQFQEDSWTVEKTVQVFREDRFSVLVPIFQEFGDRFSVSAAVGGKVEDNWIVLSRTVTIEEQASQTPFTQRRTNPNPNAFRTIRPNQFPRARYRNVRWLEKSQWDAAQQKVLDNELAGTK